MTFASEMMIALANLIPMKVRSVVIMSMVVVPAGGGVADLGLEQGRELCETTEVRLASWRVAAYAASLTSDGEDQLNLVVAMLAEPTNESRAVELYLKQSRLRGAEKTMKESHNNHGVAYTDSKHLSDFFVCRSLRPRRLRVLGCTLGDANVPALATSGPEGETAQCQISPAQLSHMRIGIYDKVDALLHLDLGAGGPSGQLRLNLCTGPFAEPTRLPQVTACTQPLYAYQRLRREHRYLLEDWLEYHREIFGLDFQLYDIDGSFGKVKGSRFRGFVRYLDHWPATLSPALATMSLLGFPLCTEAFAYAHCLASQRARKRWALLLHTPDTYLRTEEPLASKQSPLSQTLFGLMEQAGGDQILDHISISSVSFARSQLGRAGSRPAEGSADFWRRGSVVATSLLAFAHREHLRGVPLLNPAQCFSSCAHGCGLSPELTGSASGSWSTASSGLSGKRRRCWDRMLAVGEICVLRAHGLVAHHYVEAWSWDSGRCSRMSHVMDAHDGKGGLFQTLPDTQLPCDVEDRSLLWAAQLLLARNATASQDKWWPV